MTLRAGASLVLAVALALAAGCGGRPKPPLTADPVALLKNGNYRAARLAAEARGGKSSIDRAVIALSRIGENPDHEAAALASRALRDRADDASKVDASRTMLRLLGGIPALGDEERSLLAAQIALDGALLSGDSASVPSGASPEARRALAVAVLERTEAALRLATELEGPRILAIWNGCFTLLGAELSTDDEVAAWALYLAIARFAVAVENLEPASDLTRAVLGSAVAAAEASPFLAPAVRCDLSSPFDALRKSLARSPELGARLEKAVAKALGCTRGRYAPKGKDDDPAEQ